MKIISRILTATILCLGLTPAFAQLGQMPSGSKLDPAMEKLFGANTTFTAAMESQTTQKSGDVITMPGKITFDSGKARFEMNMSEAKGLKTTPNAAKQMKAMGLDQLVSISRPDKKMSYVMYPGLESYVNTPLKEAQTGTNNNFKTEITKIGEEVVNGYPCVENKVVVTDDKGEKREFTVWNATKLKNFPVKIETEQQGNTVNISYSGVSFSKPEASLFEPPASYTHYDSMQEMIQQVMMKRMAGAQAIPVPPPGQ